MTFLFWTLLLYALCLLGGHAEAQTLVYLNVSNCNSTDCFANNAFSYYLAVDLGETLRKPLGEQGNIPSFVLSELDVIEIDLILPLTPLRYFALTAYDMKKSDGALVFADIGPSLNMFSIVDSCNFSTVDAVWGSRIRFTLSAATDTWQQEERQDSLLCHLHMRLPGEPYVNFTAPKHYCKDPPVPPDVNPSRFSVLFRLTLPENATSLNHYLEHLSEFSKVRVHHVSLLNECNVSVYGYPSYPPRPFLTSENQDPKTVTLFHTLFNQVCDQVMTKYPNSELLRSEMFPWLQDINYTMLGGFSCINASKDCQGAGYDSVYLRSLTFNMTKNTSFLAMGLIHHYFQKDSFYSSLSFYKFVNNTDKSSSVALRSIVDSDQRDSALDYFRPSDHVESPLNSGAEAIIPQYYVVNVGYSCLEDLPSTTRCLTFSSEEVPENTTVFLLTRLYANPAANPSSLIPDVVLKVSGIQ